MNIRLKTLLTVILLRSLQLSCCKHTVIFDLQHMRLFLLSPLQVPYAANAAHHKASFGHFCSFPCFFLSVRVPLPPSLPVLSKMDVCIPRADGRVVTPCTRLTL